MKHSELVEYKDEKCRVLFDNPKDDRFIQLFIPSTQESKWVLREKTKPTSK